VQDGRYPTDVPWFDQGACSFVPTYHRSGARAEVVSNSPRRFARWDRNHAQPRLGGEHGEDQRFDTAEHAATLMVRSRRTCRTARELLVRLRG
jgi:hypothetical protein